MKKEIQTFHRTVKLKEYLKDTGENVALIEEQIQTNKSWKWTPNHDKKDHTLLT